MKVSIVTVVYNGEKVIDDCVLSVLSQTYKDIEYILIDGGSTDGTLAKLEKYKEHISILVSEPDKGIYDAMNKGMKTANGESELTVPQMIFRSVSTGKSVISTEAAPS